MIPSEKAQERYTWYDRQNAISITFFFTLIVSMFIAVAMSVFAYNRGVEFGSYKERYQAKDGWILPEGIVEEEPRCTLMQVHRDR